MLGHIFAFGSAYFLCFCDTTVTVSESLFSCQYYMAEWNLFHHIVELILLYLFYLFIYLFI